MHINIVQYKVLMGRIHQLDAHVQNMIAAGEVVERPMGVVKELVENAIDAGSTQITISIEEGGLSKIVIEDNGCGMSSEDAEMAFLRHATSKIQKENDLFSIHTLGFRGEALPSIAAVSKVTLITSDGNDNTKVVIAYGQKESASPYPCNKGTEITVEGLFYRTPARLKHMRSASYEASLIQDVIYRFALSHPEISFHLINEGRDAFRTSGQGDLLEVVFNVYGRSASENAIEVDFSDFDYQVSGYIIKPDITRASNKMMHVFLNGRMVRTYKIYKAIEEGYEGFLPNGRYPLCVLNIKMDPHLLDVNVHPSKWEVRISKEIQLEALLKDGVHKALNTEEVIPTASVHEAKVEYYQPLSFEEELKQPSTTITQENKKAVIEKPEVFEEDKEFNQAVYFEAKEDEQILKELHQSKQPIQEETIPFPELHVIGQYHQKYILCESEHGIAIIDQFAAQKKIVYSTIKNKMKEESVMNDLLLPITLQAGDDLVQRCDEINEVMEEFHIQFEPFGSDVLIVRSLPSWCSNVEEEQFLNDVLDAFRSDNTKHFLTIEKDKIIKLASNHVLKKVNTLSMDEMKEIIYQLKECENPFVGVDSKPIFIILDEKDLSKEFGR